MEGEPWGHLALARSELFPSVLLPRQEAPCKVLTTLILSPPGEFSHREVGKVSCVSWGPWGRLSPFCYRGARAEVPEPPRVYSRGPLCPSKAHQGAPSGGYQHGTWPARQLKIIVRFY